MSDPLAPQVRTHDPLVVALARDAPPESVGSARPAPRPVNLVILAPRMQPSDRLVRVLAEGLRSIAERGAREKTERRNRAIIVARIDGDEP